MNSSKTLYGVALASIMIISSGCATIVSGTTQKISVTSVPSDATAKADNNLTAKTPAIFTLDRKNDHAIEVSKEGFKTATVMIKRSFNGAAAGNILIGGIIGGGVDMVSGASNKLVPERIDLVLEEGAGSSAAPKFASQKDADFYEKNILKTRNKKVEPDKPAAILRSGPENQANFGPKISAEQNR